MKILRGDIESVRGLVNNDFFELVDVIWSIDRSGRASTHCGYCYLKIIVLCKKHNSVFTKTLKSHLNAKFNCPQCIKEAFKMKKRADAHSTTGYPLWRRVCPICSDESFVKRANLNKICKKCYNKTSRPPSRPKKEKNKALLNAKMRQRNRDRKEKILNYMGKSCAHCKTDNLPNCCYDLHHIDPLTKSMGISFSSTKKWEDIVEELKKCIVLCANCHRIQTAKEDYSI